MCTMDARNVRGQWASQSPQALLVPPPLPAEQEAMGGSSLSGFGSDLAERIDQLEVLICQELKVRGQEVSKPPTAHP